MGTAIHYNFHYNLLPCIAIISFHDYHMIDNISQLPWPYSNDIVFVFKTHNHNSDLIVVLPLV